VDTLRLGEECAVKKEPDNPITGGQQAVHVSGNMDFCLDPTAVFECLWTGNMELEGPVEDVQE
jgi:hypothetical protein